MKIAVVLCLLSLVACNHVYQTTGGDDGSTQGPAPGDAGASDAAASDAGASDAASSTHDAALVTDDLGTCAACDTPPDSCHAKSGTCEGGVCVYAFVDGATCDDGNDCTVGDTCSNNGCFGTPMVCDSAPVAVCTSATQSKTYDAQGACSGGLCVYQSHTVACSGSCTGGTCATNACAGVTCDTPPSACYASAGTCASGSCSYAYADGATCDDANACTTGDSCETGTCQGIPTSCATPPKNTCANATTLKSYASSGACSAADGACSYSFSYVSCPAGCASGACKAAGWTAMTSNTTQTLRGVWGASATQVWAVGDGGVVTHYDGTKWEVVPGPANNFDEIDLIHGSSATDVYVAVANVLYRYDGTSWSTVGQMASDQEIITGIWATGNATKDVYFSLFVDVGEDYAPALSKISSDGTVTNIATASGVDVQPDVCAAVSRGIWVNSANDIIVNGCEAMWWNGSTLAPLGDTNMVALGGRYWSAGASSVFSLYTDQGLYGSSMTSWNGTSWTTINSGLDGFVYDLWGTSAKSMYLVGEDDSQADAVAAIVYWDGTGLTRQTLPATGAALYAVWVASTGQVFAVGTGGSIVTGP